jgi:hypothetical protein
VAALELRFARAVLTANFKRNSMRNEEFSRPKTKPRIEAFQGARISRRLP